MNQGFSRRWIIVIAAAVAVLLFLVLTVPSMLASYYRNEGINAYFNDDFEKAEAFLEKSVRFSEKNPVAYYYLGKIALGKPDLLRLDALAGGDYRKAVEYFEKAEATGIADADLDLYSQMLNYAGFSYRALAESDVKLLDRAAEKWEKHIEVDSENSFFSRYYLAVDYVERQNKPQEALEVLTPALEQAYTDYHQERVFRVYSYLSRLEYYFDNFDDAIKYADLTVAERGEDDTQFETIYARTVRALSYAKKGDISRAEEGIKNIEKTIGAPGSYDCFLALAYSYAGEHRKAVEIARAAYDPADLVSSRMRCLLALRSSHKSLGNTVEAKQFSDEYEALAETLTMKDIFVWRNLEEEY